MDLLLNLGINTQNKSILQKSLNKCIFIPQMDKKKDIIKEINPRYFWDIDISKLDVSSSRRLIIERVFSLGKLEEMVELLNFYGKREVVNTLRQINYLDPKTLNFVAKLFNIPKISFKCYSRIPSNLRFWNS
jgi:hypothetical protein